MLLIFFFKNFWRRKKLKWAKKFTWYGKQMAASMNIQNPLLGHLLPRDMCPRGHKAVSKILIETLLVLTEPANYLGIYW